MAKFILNVLNKTNEDCNLFYVILPFAVTLSIKKTDYSNLNK